MSGRPIDQQIGSVREYNKSIFFFFIVCCYFAPANESLIHFLFIQFFVAFGEKRMHDQPSECEKFRSILFIFVCLLFFRERFVCVTVLVFSLFLGLSSIQNSR